MNGMESPTPVGPMRFGDMVVATYRYLRRHPAATIGIGALLGTVTTVVTGVVIDGLLYGNGRGAELQRVLAGETLTASEANRMLQSLVDLAPYLALAATVAALVQFSAMGVMTVGMVRELRQEPVKAGELWRLVPWRRVIAVNLIVSGILLVVLGGIAVVVAAGGEIVAWLAMGFGLGFALVLGTIATLAVPACIIDDVGAWTAVRRAMAVSRGALSRILVQVFAALMLWTIIGDMLGSLLGGVLGLLAGGPSTSTGATLSRLVSQITAAAITLPAAAATAVLIYRDRVQQLGGGAQ